MSNNNLEISNIVYDSHKWGDIEHFSYAVNNDNKTQSKETYYRWTEVGN